MIRSSVASALRALADLIHPPTLPQKRPCAVMVEIPVLYFAGAKAACDHDEVVRACEKAIGDMLACRDQGAA